jgi:sarcosine oxidase
MRYDAAAMGMANRYDVAVIGAGVFGAWTAWHLAQRGRRVALIDAYGGANARASSGGETRIVRMGYGADELYTRFAVRSLAQWKEFFAKTRDPLFVDTGVLWLAGKEDSRLRETMATLRRHDVAFEEMDPVALKKRYPQVNLEDVSAGILEVHSGLVLARRAVSAVIRDAIRHEVQYLQALIATPRGSGRMESVVTGKGQHISAEHFVFACGAWLGKIFPDVLGRRIFPTRQEVFFFGIPAGDTRFGPAELPTWLFQEDEYYGMPDIEERGLKIAQDRHGARVDPDTQSRIVSAEEIAEVRRYVARRFPALRDAPIVETRVCQYENTSSGDFLIDQHPEMENVWFLGGGSGHGFKHGPAVGEYVSGQILDGLAAEPQFSLASKDTVQRRTVH